ncbi:HAMP domain-containing histidine kinase [bacterium]|nr:MAG: HAMP domain-containing histidine kinase [bacterium]
MNLSAAAAGAALRAANIALFVLWLWGLTQRGLLASLLLPGAVAALWAAGNAALAFRRRETPRVAEAALIAGDLALVWWAASWTGTYQPDALLALLVPVFMAAVRLPPAWAAALSGGALAAWYGVTPPPRLDAAYRGVFLAAAPWGLALFARAALRSRAAAVHERTALAKSLFFHEFLSLTLFQLRDYLVSMSSVSQHLEKTAAPPDRELAGKLARAIAEMTGKLSRMSDAVEAHTTTRRPSKAPAWSLAELVRECVDSAAASYPVAGLHARHWVDPRIPALSGDRDAAAAALTAVLENSMEAFVLAGRGGHLSVSAMLDGENAVLECADDAGGLPAAAEAELFKPLFTTKSARGGIGLGLAMARRLLERTGGTMSVRGEGGRVLARLELPLKAGLPRVRNEESTWAGRRSS